MGVCRVVGCKETDFFFLSSLVAFAGVGCEVSPCHPRGAQWMPLTPHKSGNLFFRFPTLAFSCSLRRLFLDFFFLDFSRLVAPRRGRTGVASTLVHVSSKSLTSAPPRKILFCRIFICPSTSRGKFFSIWRKHPRNFMWTNKAR